MRRRLLLLLVPLAIGLAGCGGDDGPSETDVVAGKVEDSLNDPGVAGEDYDPNPKVTGCEEDSHVADQTGKDAGMGEYDPGDDRLPPGEAMGIGVCVVDGRIEPC